MSLSADLTCSYHAKGTKQNLFPPNSFNLFLKMQQLVGLTIILLVAVAAEAQLEIRPTDSNWLTTLRGLTAGQTLIVHEGTYTLTSKFATIWAGTAAAPITVLAAAGEGRPIFKQTTGQNIWNLGGSYFTVKGLEFTGGGRGIRLGESSSTFEIFSESRSINFKF